MFQPMLDVATCFLTVHRADVTARDDALTQLQHRRAFEHAPKLRLAHQKALQ
jgi:hypothetical protein